MARVKDRILRYFTSLEPRLFPLFVLCYQPDSRGFTVSFPFWASLFLNALAVNLIIRRLRTGLYSLSATVTNNLRECVAAARSRFLLSPSIVPDSDTFPSLSNPTSVTEAPSPLHFLSFFPPSTTTTSLLNPSTYPSRPYHQTLITTILVLLPHHLFPAHAPATSKQCPRSQKSMKFCSSSLTIHTTVRRYNYCGSMVGIRAHSSSFNLGRSLRSC